MKSGKTLSFITSILLCIAESLVIGLVISLALSLLVLLLADSARAESMQTASVTTEIRDINEVRRGSLLFRGRESMASAPLLQTDVSMQVNGMLARVAVTQQFRNETNDWQEGIYVFPLPTDAAVDTLRMHIGERIIEGEIQEKQQARKNYEKARDSGRKASLVEQERPNIFTASVANIAPGEIIRVEIGYQHIARYDQGEFSLRFPTVVGPRYIPGDTKIEGFDGHGWSVNTDRVPDAARITPPVMHPDSGSINPLSINVNLDAGFPLQHIGSSFHSIQINETAPTRYSIMLGDGPVPADRDFELRWQPEPASAPRAALFTEQLAGNDYALVMLLPPAQKHAGNLDREVIFVIDTSGSMAGASIRQARQALLQALDRLGPGDRFNIIQFNTFTTRLFRIPQPVNHSSLRKARSYIQSLDANGGTEMAPALQQALENVSENPLMRQVIFITDGSIGNESGLFRIIHRDLGNSRLFTVGIGSAPNGYFMQRAAELGKGSYLYIGQLADVETRMRSLFSKLENPQLSDLHIEAGPGNMETWPQPIPDLYHGEPLLLNIRAQQLPDSIHIRGTTGNRDWKTALPIRNGKNSDGIARLWARRKIASLMNRWHLGEDREDLRQLITETALNHHLVSRFTSLVAIDKTPARTKEALLKKGVVPTNLPAGWKYEKVFGQLPATATPAMLHLITGLLLFIFSALLGLFRRHVQSR